MVFEGNASAGTVDNDGHIDAGLHGVNLGADNGLLANTGLVPGGCAETASNSGLIPGGTVGVEAVSDGGIAVSVRGASVQLTSTGRRRVSRP